MLIKKTKFRYYILFSITLFFLVSFIEIIPDYFTLFYNLWEVLDSSTLKNSIKDYESQITAMEIENSRLKSLETYYISTNESKSDISSIISFLDVVSQKSFIKNYSLRPAAAEKKDNLSVLPIEVEIGGDYSQVFNYINFIERSSRVIIIQNLSIKPKDILKDSLIVKTNLDVYLNL